MFRLTADFLWLPSNFYKWIINIQIDRKFWGKELKIKVQSWVGLRNSAICFVWNFIFATNINKLFDDTFQIFKNEKWFLRDNHHIKKIC